MVFDIMRYREAAETIKTIPSLASDGIESTDFLSILHLQVQN